MDLHQKIKRLFQLSDSLLLPDEITFDDISKKEDELREWVKK